LNRLIPWLSKHSNFVRIGLILPIVAVCHLFEWNVWRTLVTDLLGAWSRMAGVPMWRVAPDAFVCNGHVFRVAISCTIVDAWLASVPLLWERNKSWMQNLMFFGVYFVALSIANLVRLEAGFVLNLRGVPWWLGHEVAAGVFYFALFCWIARRRGWTQAFSNWVATPIAAPARPATEFSASRPRG
jgi:hypothetical protein